MEPATLCCNARCQDDILNKLVENSITCRTRINYLVKKYKMEVRAACIHVSQREYPQICGPCDPEKCYEPLSEYTAIKNPEKRRYRAHWCWWRAHMATPMRILQNEFGFTKNVNAELEEWDIIFDGYPHCGSNKRQDRNFDWKMERGLNAYLNKKGWDTLEPHQVWFPCMGCKSSYCNKRELCYLTRKFDPSSCYVLPEDYDRLVVAMNEKGPHRWVLKQDSEELHAHYGTGIKFIQTAEELPAASEQSQGIYLVQPFIQQKMGTGNYFRRHELKLFLTVTSTMPLRVYAYSEMFGTYSFKNLDDKNPVDYCSLDTHGALNKKCRLQGLAEDEAFGLNFHQVATNLHMSEQEQQQFRINIYKLIAEIILAAQPTIQSHIVNKGITKSKAMCFSFLRADIVITNSGKGAIYEINEFPYVNNHGESGRITQAAFRDLFKMIGLDQSPLPVSERRDYELAHLGNWTPLVIDDKIVVDS